MLTYDVICPVCGKVNHDLYLEETEGWMECVYCGNSRQDLRFKRARKIPVFRMDQLEQVEAYLAAQ